ncbi:MAG: hypothetical protein AAF092_10815 [Pseudomonadota bacterium]
MTDWNQVISRLSTSETHDVDDILGGASPASAAEPPQRAAGPAPMPIAALWANNLSEEEVYLGVIVDAPLERPAAIAGQLAAMAVERSIHPIIFSRIGYCGLERFGFRVEDTSYAGSVSSVELEQQLCNFWNISVTVSTAQLSALR